MKDQETVIQEFNDIVNMSVSELEDWLKSEDSQGAGWTKEDGDGESVGHDSGRKIINILKSNPGKAPSKYTEDQVAHMRKVVSYCKRHLAQEEKTNSEKSTEEVKKTNSYASLKNWGHDILKKKSQSNGGEKHNETNGEKQSGEKRKAVPDGDGSANKKRETNKGKSGETDDHKGPNGKETKANGQNGTKDQVKKQQEGTEGDEEEEEEEEEEDAGGEEEEEESEEDADEEPQPKGKQEKGGKGSNGSSKDPKAGDTVSWNWGNGQPEGKVLDVKEDKATVKTKNGNEVSRDGEPGNPAVVLDTGKSKAIKLSNELNET